MMWFDKNNQQYCIWNGGKVHMFQSYLEAKAFNEINLDTKDFTWIVKNGDSVVCITPNKEYAMSYKRVGFTVYPNLKTIKGDKK